MGQYFSSSTTSSTILQNLSEVVCLGSNDFGYSFSASTGEKDNPKVQIDDKNNVESKDVLKEEGKTGAGIIIKKVSEWDIKVEKRTIVNNLREFQKHVLSSIKDRKIFIIDNIKKNRYLESLCNDPFALKYSPKIINKFTDVKNGLSLLEFPFKKEDFPVQTEEEDFWNEIANLKEMIDFKSSLVKQMQTYVVKLFPTHQVFEGMKLSNDTLQVKYIVNYYSEFGDLKSYWDGKNGSDKDIKLEFFNFLSRIAVIMSIFHDANVVHGDLCARNFVVVKKDNSKEKGSFKTVVVRGFYYSGNLEEEDDKLVDCYKFIELVLFLYEKVKFKLTSHEKAFVRDILTNFVKEFDEEKNRFFQKIFEYIVTNISTKLNITLNEKFENIEVIKKMVRKMAEDNKLLQQKLKKKEMENKKHIIQRERLIIDVIKELILEFNTDKSKIKKMVKNGFTERLYYQAKVELNPLILLDKYKTILLKESEIKVGKSIGEGAFGKVYKGFYGKTTVAIKEYQCNSKKSSLQHMIDIIKEFEVLKNVKHKNCVKLLGYVLKVTKDFYKTPSFPKFIMEFGISLQTFLINLKIQYKKKLEVDMKLNFILQIAEGMGYLHSQNYIHRDLKMENIIVADDKNSKSPTLKIIDFGLTRKSGNVPSSGSYQSSSLWYVSPELYGNMVKYVKTKEKALFSKSSDVFAFGIVMCFIIFELYDDNNDYNMVAEEVLYLQNFYDAKSKLLNPVYGEDWPIISLEGKNLVKKDETYSFLYKLMKKCTGFNPSKRPAFTEICKSIFDFQRKKMFASI